MVLFGSPNVIPSEDQLPDIVVILGNQDDYCTPLANIFLELATLPEDDMGVKKRRKRISSPWKVRLTSLQIIL